MLFIYFSKIFKNNIKNNIVKITFQEIYLFNKLKI